MVATQGKEGGQGMLGSGQRGGVGTWILVSTIKNKGKSAFHERLPKVNVTIFQGWVLETKAH